MSNDTHAGQPAHFDHLVMVLRDELGARAPAFERDGFHLTALSRHNVGSFNHLMVFESSYVELLGWPQGEPPARKEISEQPLGMDALVFRSDDAAATHARLRRAGLPVNPVQPLERPLEFKGRTEMARFATVRFSTQPIDGVRIYFCQHLTPQFVWDAGYMRHGNGAVALAQITIEAPDAKSVAATLAAIAGGAALEGTAGAWKLDLPNLRLLVKPHAGLRHARISGADLRYGDGSMRPLDAHL